MLKSELGKDKNEFEISTNILKDKDGNLIANGTLVTFTLTNAETVRQCEATLKNGQVSIVIPNTNKEYKVYAKIHSVISNTITLAP